MFHMKKRYLLALYRLEEDMQRVLEKLEGLGMPPSVGGGDSFPEGDEGDAGTTPQPPAAAAPLTRGAGAGDEWFKSGIDSILSYQAGKKQKGEKA